MQTAFRPSVWRSLLIATAVALQACATIPPESVSLSQEVGRGIAESKRSYDALLNSFFADKRRQVIAWARGDYLTSLLKNIAAQPGAPKSFSPAQLQDVLDIVLKEQEAKLADLDRTRALVQARSDEHYALLNQANAGVTGLLQSAVKLNEAKSDAFASLKQQSGGRVDLSELEARFNDYLQKAGAASDKASSLYEAAKAMSGH